MDFATDDLRIANIRPLLPPAILIEELPASAEIRRHVATSRATVADILHGRDDRVVAVVGPCSVHDTQAGLDYARRLKALGDELAADVYVVMRTYFEKPRTTIGWKGLINDPRLDGSFDINQGLRMARKFLRDVLELGLPTGTEFLDPISPQFVADLVSWGAIGARTTESQVHRELASGLSMPVGFKNGTKGTVQIAVDAVGSSSHPHRFLSVTKQGLSAIVATAGNEDCHVILRGGDGKPNFGPEAVAAAVALLEKAKRSPRLMVDCSHANSGKDPSKQPAVAAAIAEQIASGSRSIFGIMLESFLVSGRQDHTPGKDLVYGQSITDGCLGWDETEPTLRQLADAVRRRRST